MTSQTLTTLAAATIITANLGSRFPGRAALVKAAQRGNEVALTLLTATPTARRLAAIKRTVDAKLAKAMGFGDELARIDQLRARRANARHANPDELAARQPGNVAKRATLTAFLKALTKAEFRTATHAHSETIKFVEIGHEYASGDSGSMSSSSAGMSKAYCRLGYRVTTSNHTWHVTTDFLKVPRGQRASRGCLRLSPTYYVTQGRGTKLNTHRG